MVDMVSYLIVVESLVLEISQLGCMGCNNSKNFNWQFSPILTDNFICCVNYLMCLFGDSALLEKQKVWVHQTQRAAQT
jgi:hypothetical protein